MESSYSCLNRVRPRKNTIEKELTGAASVGPEGGVRVCVLLFLDAWQ